MTHHSMIPQIPALALLLLASAAPAGTTNFVSGLLAEIDVYHDIGDVKADGPPVVCHIDCKNPDTVRAAIKEGPRSKHIVYMTKLKGTVEKLTGLPYVPIHYTQLDGEDLNAGRTKAILITMMDKGIAREHTERLLSMIRKTSIPTIGFCGGHQLIARAYGSQEALMRPLAPGEEDTHASYHPGYYKEWCFMPVRIIRPDPLFNGFSENVTVREFHAFEVKQLPEEFELLASSDGCRIQAMRHKSKLIYGTQFHPEHFDAAHPDGEKILANFFEIVGLLAKKP